MQGEQWGCSKWKRDSGRKQGKISNKGARNRDYFKECWLLTKKRSHKRV